MLISPAKGDLRRRLLINRCKILGFLYRVPCRIGMCTSPVEVTSSQLIATELCPAIFVQALLYPGAIAKAFNKNKTIPSFGNLLKLYNLTNMKKHSAAIDLHHLEVRHIICIVLFLSRCLISLILQIKEFKYSCKIMQEFYLF